MVLQTESVIYQRPTAVFPFFQLPNTDMGSLESKLLAKLNYSGINLSFFSLPELNTP